MLRRDVDGGQVTRTHYLGSVEVVWEGGSPQNGSGVYRRTIAGVALVTYQEATDTSIVRYQHTDHLGSVVAISDATGQVVARMAFDAWGKRQDPYHQAPDWEQWVSPLTPAWAEAMLGITPRGFTGHEHVDALGFIHMNGRIYDPHLARFLQADPIIEDVTTLNRYTYVHNNPLLYTDPSGHLSFKQFARIALSVAISVYTSGVINGATWAIGSGLSGAAAVGAAAAGGALAGYVATGSIEGALWGAFSGVVFYGIGQDLAGSATPRTGVLGTSYTAGELAMAAVAHGIAGGTISKLQGGRFGHGFLSAGVAKLATPAVTHNISNDYGRAITLALVGGTVSTATGGKFANGAVTAAMAYAFNQALSEELSRGFKVKSTLEQIEELTTEDLEILFERNFTDDDTLIFKENLRVQLNADFWSDTSSLREAAMDMVEAEYKSAGFGPARGLSRSAIARAISSRLNIPEGYIKQTLRAERVIQEVGSIDPTLKGVVEGIRQGNEEVLRVWNDY